ncbi:MAG: YccF domain-containing protein [Oscillospiraceae bacterium]|nr:YccF domain-containing protein [Oscillospiraceae bacterium]
MGCLGNVIWFLFGGLWQGLGWTLAGVLWCVTILGIPIGRQCFKLAGLAFFPFGKEVIYGGGAVSLLANLLWLLLSGVVLALAAVVNGLLLCVTVVGIPFGLQCFKLAKLALMPFGAEVHF